ncbi:MAG TPA: hypothetical protein VGP44_02450, partial [Gemmatimonadales bacterium]|nr:hypothetical protein [Gemmatimonadales bacterium]
STAARSTPTVITGCTPMHQDGPSVSAKTRGRAVAFYPSVVLTLASHTTTNKSRPITPGPTTMIIPR